MSKRNLLLAVLILIAALLTLMNWTSRSRRADDMALLECANLYAAAANPDDTAAVDSSHPIQQPRGTTTRVTCGDLRR